MKNISSTYMFINSRGGGLPVYSRHTHLYIWGLAGVGGWGGMGWEASLHEEYFHYMIILQCFIKFIYSLWRGLTMCTVVSQFMVSKLILNFFQFAENPYSQNRWLRMAPSRELCSRRTLVRRIQQKLNQVVEIVKRYGLFNDK